MSVEEEDRENLAEKYGKMRDGYLDLGTIFEEIRALLELAISKIQENGGWGYK